MTINSDSAHQKWMKFAYIVTGSIFLQSYWVLNNITHDVRQVTWFITWLILTNSNWKPPLCQTFLDNWSHWKIKFCHLLDNLLLQKSFSTNCYLCRWHVRNPLWVYITLLQRNVANSYIFLVPIFGTGQRIHSRNQ